MAKKINSALLLATIEEYDNLQETGREIIVSEKKENHQEETSYRLALGIREKIELESVLEKEMRQNEYLSDEAKRALTNIIKKLDNLKYIHLENKRTATKKANEVKKKESIKKITDALNVLRVEGKKPNINLVAKTANMSYNTVKKYKDLLDI